MRPSSPASAGASVLRSASPLIPRARDARAQARGCPCGSKRERDESAGSAARGERGDRRCGEAFDGDLLGLPPGRDETPDDTPGRGVRADLRPAGGGAHVDRLVAGRRDRRERARDPHGCRGDDPRLHRSRAHRQSRRARRTLPHDPDQLPHHHRQAAPPHAPRPRADTHHERRPACRRAHRRRRHRAPGAQRGRTHVPPRPRVRERGSSDTRATTRARTAASRCNTRRAPTGTRRFSAPAAPGRC
jgi:hypothetical protein